MPTEPKDDALLGAMTALALEAGALALSIYGRDFAIEAKSDASPVTEADRLGEEIILAGLARLAPEIPTLAEEAASAGQIPRLGEEFFLVDPLDGTKEFVTKTGEFTVNIALIRAGAPVLGVAYAPAIGKL
ncbi:MAG: 3'(2'),5'-bisphosphate nucleotidase CysQ family protein, partial [Pseudomonadota bacterium]